MSDTSPAAARFYYEHLRSLSPAERLRIASELSIAVRQLAEAGVRQRAPGATAREVMLLVVTRLYGEEVAQRFFGSTGELAG
jgi:hypothetical protein